ncbi:hypothetical protein V6N11_075053 [Hibiscus sabdariffa]|uniref:Uncharacterized protein n=1 Tax=Hibiscus sabdariffa TaxID=183260 RepID=A0ABR2R5U3_9ROSI
MLFQKACSFSEANLLGKGGFGLVHKGTLLHSNSAHFCSWNSYSLQRFQVHKCPSKRKLRSKDIGLRTSQTDSRGSRGVGHNILHDRKKLRKVIDPEMAPSQYTIESITMFSSLASQCVRLKSREQTLLEGKI